MHELTSQLIRSGVLKTSALIRLFESIDRKDFVRPGYENEACGDYPLPIGAGQTISQPYTVAFMLELLQPSPGEKILDVGSGSGWTTALLSKAVGPNGRVIGLELVPELVIFGKGNLSKYNFTNAEIRQAVDVLGLPEEAPFDKILVSASADKLPKPLVNQLKVGGTMVIPIGNDVWEVKKLSGGKISLDKYGGFIFVPLVEKH